MSFHKFLARFVLYLALLQLATCAVLKPDSTTPKDKTASVTQAVTSTGQPVPLSSSKTSSSKVPEPLATHAKSTVTSCPVKRHGLVKRACSYQHNAPWALQRISQRAPMAWRDPKALEDGMVGWRHKFTYDQKWGQNVIAYVIDSGVNGTHRAFQKDQVEKGESVTAVKQSQSTETNPFTDTSSHGTGVASIIGGQETGIARSVTIFPIKISNSIVKVSEDTLIEGINIAVKDWTARSSKNSKLKAVINLSYSFMYRPAIQAAFQSAENAGILIVYSAASEKKNTCDARAKNTGQILVASIKPTFYRRLVDEYHPDMNYGPCIDITAPGVYIWAADNEDGSEIAKDGNSFAAPLVSGVIASLLSSHDGYKNLNPSEFKEKFWMSLVWMGLRNFQKRHQIGC